MVDPSNLSAGYRLWAASHGRERRAEMAHVTAPARAHVTAGARSLIRMFGKAWQWLKARVNGKPQGPLRLRVHRDTRYQSFWQPTAIRDQQPGTEIHIFLEASNMAAAGYWIVAAELADIPTIETVVGVRDARTGVFAPDNPLPPRQITTVSLRFLAEGQPPSTEEPFHVAVILIDHVGGRHPVKVIMH